MLNYLHKRIDAGPSIVDADPITARQGLPHHLPHAFPPRRQGFPGLVACKAQVSEACHLLNQADSSTISDLQLPRCPINPHVSLLHSCRSTPCASGLVLLLVALSWLDHILSTDL